MNSKIKLLFYILIIIILAILIYKVVYTRYDTFDIPQTTKQYKKKSYNDGTQLYGSLFLDNLNGVIKNMTDPPIMYDKKTIELNRYSDALL
jgi:hypothetical protein